MSFVGARWWKFDFHTHTPASFDYGRTDGSLKSTKTPRDWLLDYIGQGIECVAVTDHNSGGWIDCLKNEAEILRGEGHQIFVFPGVEITANSNIHILGIFDTTLTSADVSAVIGAAKFRGTKGDSDSVAEESAENVIKEIISAGGVAIPAHIDMKAGLCQQTSSHTIRQVCEHANAVEIIFPDEERDDAPLSRYKNLNIELPSVIGSDAHHPDDIGRAFTWVKMANPSIEGLKLALVDGSSSIIRSDDKGKTQSPNRSSSTLLKSVTIEKAKYAGRSVPLIIEFNPWLNSIIGGRGSGKSSVLEFIRLGMGRSVDLLGLSSDNEIRRSFESFNKIPLSRDADGVMLADTKISCIYARDDVNYRLVWTKESNSVSIERLEGESWIIESGEAYSRFPIKIFSQKQIFNLAKNPNTLLRLIDESSTVGFQQWKMKWDEKRTRFQTLCSQRRELELKLSNKNVLQGQLSDVEQKIITIEKSGHAEILRSYQDFRNKRSSIVEYENNIEKLKNKIQLAVAEQVEEIKFPESLDVNINSEEEVALKIADLNKVISAIKDNINESLNKIDSEISIFKQWYAESDFNKNHIEVEGHYNNLIENLKNDGVDSPSDHPRLIMEREEVNKSLKEMEATEMEIDYLRDSINIAYQEIIDCRRELTLNRVRFLRSNLSDNPSIQIEILPFSDADNLDASFRSVLGRSDNAFSVELFDLERECGFLFNLNKNLSSLKVDDVEKNIDLWLIKIHEFKEEFVNYKNGEILNTKLGKRFLDFLLQLKPENFDSINAWFPDDKLLIKFKDGNRFKDVSQGSAGQKASAILSFLLSYGQEPLVLDQPEDDLDNGLITNLIVSKLHQNKSERQIIVVTHNPNIVVNGDSEYVVALEDRGQIRSLASGALQEVDVRKNVCEIMEGGEIALQKRYKRMFNI